MNLGHKKILVTGAGGFIGSHLVEALVAQGAGVRAFLRHNSRSDIGFLKELDQESLNCVEIFYGDLRDLDTVRQSLRGMDLVVNLAAVVGISYSYLHPQEVIDTNVVGTMNIITAARDQGMIEKIVHTSSSDVYGSAQYLPIDEKHPLHFQSPYAASKMASEALALSFYYSYELPVAIVRPFNVYGPRQSPRAVIPTIITQALSQDCVNLGDVTTTRDFNYISDIVDGFIKIITYQETNGEIINIGTGMGTSIQKIADIVGEIVGKKLQINLAQERRRPQKSEIAHSYADNYKARTLIHWRPQVDLRQGLEKTVDYILQNLQRYNPQRYYVLAEQVSAPAMVIMPMVLRLKHGPRSHRGRQVKCRAGRHLTPRLTAEIQKPASELSFLCGAA